MGVRITQALLEQLTVAERFTLRGHYGRHPTFRSGELARAVLRGPSSPKVTTIYTRGRSHCYPDGPQVPLPATNRRPNEMKPSRCTGQFRRGSYRPPVSLRGGFPDRPQCGADRPGYMQNRIPAPRRGPATPACGTCRSVGSDRQAEVGCPLLGQLFHSHLPGYESRRRT
jgi:hypothetical protein